MSLHLEILEKESASCKGANEVMDNQEEHRQSSLYLQLRLNSDAEDDDP